MLVTKGAPHMMHGRCYLVSRLAAVSALAGALVGCLLGADVLLMGAL